MPLKITLRRLWHQRRLMALLLLTVCFTTSFFALGPIYVRAIAETSLRYSLRTSTDAEFFLSITSPAMLREDSQAIIDQHLGEYSSGTDRIYQTYGTLCGFEYTPDEPLNLNTPSTAQPGISGCQQIFGYPDQEKFFRLVDGRWPVLLDPAQPQEHGKPQIEIAITPFVAERAQKQIGDILIVGTDIAHVKYLQIVGLIEPTLPDDHPFYGGERILIFGQTISLGDNTRYDFGVLAHADIFPDQIAPIAVNGNVYERYVNINMSAIRAEGIDTLDNHLTQTELDLKGTHPAVKMRSALYRMITNFREGIARTEGPIFLLSAVILLLMLYQLSTTVALTLEQQIHELSVILSRGGSLRQLVETQLVMVSLLALIGALLGPLLAMGIMALLARVGPLAAVFENFSPQAMPLNAMLLSLIAAILTALVLTFPVWQAGRQSLLQLRQTVSRPQRPVWMRYFVDVILLFAGVGLLIRLFFLIGDNSLDFLLRDPSALVRLIATGDVGVRSLGDPFNLAAPALILTGAALLWLRLFPLFLYALGKFFSASNRLMVPLALWTVQRDLGYYGYLVLLLIGTLALGASALSLGETHAKTAWEAAYYDTGGTVQLVLDPATVPENQDWRSLPGVTQAEALMLLESEEGDGNATVLWGLDAQTFGQAFPPLAETVKPLADRQVPTLPGLPLPEDTTTISIQVASEAADPVVEVRIDAVLRNQAGIFYPVHMVTDDPKAVNAFATWKADLPESEANLPWHLVGFYMPGTLGNSSEFNHAVYFDDLAAINAAGQTTVIEDFEDNDLPDWINPRNQTGLLLTVRVTSKAASGKASLRVGYRVYPLRNGPITQTFLLRPSSPQPIPVVISDDFATFWGRRNSKLRRPYGAGDTDTVRLALPFGERDITFTVLGVVSDFRTMPSNGRFMLAQTGTIRGYLNENSTPDAYYQTNRVWLDLSTHEPDSAFTNALAQIPGIKQVNLAADRYTALRREPLPNAVVGVLFVGFWLSLGLSLLGFAFHLATTAQRRAMSFAVLRAMGWQPRNIWGMLTVEQAALITPALIIGVALGVFLAYLLLPFLTSGGLLQLPMSTLLALVFLVVIVFSVLLGFTTLGISRGQITRVLKAGE